ncbi:MAG TPA: cytochrome c oxidase subunit 4 [Candidatus Dormibacteraeota bacterium]|nr:cytochrome c oxidase subunit 4 [Candidatus Dormibacteraeota bacterium]
MSNEAPSQETPESPSAEESHTLPGPSFWPFLLALGIATSLIGVITKVEVVAIGLILTLVSLGGWIREARHEYRSLP